VSADAGVVRIGLLYPLGGGEHEYYEVAEASHYRMRPYLVCAALAGGEFSHDPAALRQTGDIAALRNTAQSLVPLAPDAALWACTSGSFIEGRAHAQAQAAAIAEVIGCPASSTSLAIVHALEALAISDVGVVATYPAPTAQAFQSFLGEHGVNVKRLVHLDAPNGRAAYRIPVERKLAAGREVAGPDIGAVLIPDTAIAGMPLSVQLEPELGVPVLSANQVTIWDAWRLAGATIGVEGFGSLLAPRS